MQNFWEVAHHARALTRRQNDRRNLTQRHRPFLVSSPYDLPGQDSNLENQDQNLVCYHYTTGQSLSIPWRDNDGPRHTCLQTNSAER